eukprot:TRINITY_DN16910_c1_g2_i1.p1 TRINITY_DN16910_c1_g2~~TRINITY_DN16910_c1_g2_i1.p1  ORF type:complete len:132 (-),score=43.02 TRINITY_DN16910_c1_g2_i1:18-413(-)
MGCHTTLYDVIGVAPDASDEDIRLAYKKLIVQWHPDKNAGNEEKATARFKEIQHAHSVIGHPQKRRIYDQEGEDGLGGGGSQITSGMSDCDNGCVQLDLCCSAEALRIGNHRPTYAAGRGVSAARALRAAA